MKYLKPALTFDQQADKLLKRGLIADKSELIEKLSAVSYYRLSAYWHPFRQPDDTFRPGTTLVQVWRRYIFDRRLRLLVMDVIERAEIHLRTQLVYHHTLAHGPLGYLDRTNLPGLNVNDHLYLIDTVRKETKRSREPFVDHFFGKYTSETDLPLWMSSELMTFGAMYTLYRGVAPAIQKAITNPLGVPDKVLESWIKTLNQVRNICAHHGRLWNRVLGIKPLIPRQNKYPEWHDPVSIMNDRMFGVLSILRYLLRLVAPQSQWQARLTALIAEFPDAPIAEMGFPANWKDSPIWRSP